MHNPVVKKNIPAVCVFCGSSPGKNLKYTETARRLGTLIGEQGYRLVFGAGAVGLMGEVARAAQAAHAPVTGIIPRFLRSHEPPLETAEKLIFTTHMQERKQRMLHLADAFVLLPGGIGTLDEFFEVVVEGQLHVHKKPIVLINQDNFYVPLIKLLDHIVAEGFAHGNINALYHLAADAGEAMDIVSAALSAGEASAAEGILQD
jgi:uncharacterized protein (TIGR00730 family)